MECQELKMVRSKTHWSMPEEALLIQMIFPSQVEMEFIAM
jgi:hypothetical protein